MVIAIFNLIILLFFLSSIYGYMIENKRLKKQLRDWKKYKEYENERSNTKDERR